MWLQIELPQPAMLTEVEFDSPSSGFYVSNIGLTPVIASATTEVTVPGDYEIGLCGANYQDDDSVEADQWATGWFMVTR